MEISQRFQLEGLMFQKENTSLDTEEALEIELDEDEDTEKEEKKDKEDIVKDIEEEDKKKKFATILDSFEDREKNVNNFPKTIEYLSCIYKCHYNDQV